MRDWPREWAKDQSFYRDIATRTISGLLVVGIAYVFGVLAGYFQDPGFWNATGAFFGSLLIAAGGAGGIATTTGLLLTATSAFHAYRQRKRMEREQARKHNKPYSPTT